MISQLASVFSSQGVVLPDTELVPVPGPRRPAEQESDGGIPEGFAALFDQASAKLELSKQAIKAAKEAAELAGRRNGDAPPGEKDGRSVGSGAEAGSRLSAPGIGELTSEERKIVEKLKERDREVRNHEQAHIAASGGHARGGANYEFKTGPDGRQYAVGGHVSIDVSPVSGNPQATLQKAMAVRRAATAPGEPSGADLAVASAASEMARQAGKELASTRAGAADPVREGAPENARPGSEARRNPYAAYAANGAAFSSGASGAGRSGTGRFVNAFA